MKFRAWLLQGAEGGAPGGAPGLAGGGGAGPAGGLAFQACWLVLY